MAEDHSLRVDPFDLVHPPEVIAEFVGRLTAGLHPVTSRRRMAERRGQPRCILSAAVEVQPLDNGLEIKAEPFRAETRNISTTGIRLIHARPVNAKFLALRLTHPDGQQLQTIVEVVWCRPRGRLFDVGGTFVTKPLSADACGARHDSHTEER